MLLIKNLQEWCAIRHHLGAKAIGFVPTMGNLHEGHVSLLERSVNENEVTVLSCYINPTQFNDENDFEQYPRSLDEDVCLAKAAGVQYVLAPTDIAIYPEGNQFRIHETLKSLDREGAFRPGHFDGMLTIVLKLLLLVRAKRAYFGEKDFQQLQLVQDMVQAFFIETEIVPCPTLRNAFGLPLSSRNRRMNARQLEQSKYFPALFHSNQSCKAIAEALEKKHFKVDYVVEEGGRRYAAVWIDDIRLIDNVEIKEVGSC